MSPSERLRQSWSLRAARMPSSNSLASVDETNADAVASPVPETIEDERSEQQQFAQALSDAYKVSTSLCGEALEHLRLAALMSTEAISSEDTIKSISETFSRKMKEELELLSSTIADAHRRGIKASSERSQKRLSQQRRVSEVRIMEVKAEVADAHKQSLAAKEREMEERFEPERKAFKRESTTLKFQASLISSAHVLTRWVPPCAPPPCRRT